MKTPRCLAELLAALFLIACADGAAGGGAASVDADREDGDVQAPLDVGTEETGDGDTTDPDAGDSPDAASAPDAPPPSDLRGDDGDALPDPDVHTLDGTTSDPGALDDGEPADGSADADDVGATDTGAALDSADASEPDAEPPWVLFDTAAIHDAATADCRFERRRTRLRGVRSFDVWDVSLRSWEVLDGRLSPVTLRGFAARPTSASGRIPGIVNVHGLGGFASEAMAIGPADLVDAFVVALTGPGGGDPAVPASQSEGMGSGALDGYRLFDTITDPRGTWLWAHAVGAMRGVTCLAAHADVDPTRLGMTGFSAGGIATLISAAVDGRLAAAVPISGTGGWRRSAEAPQSWFHALLTRASLSTASPEWDALTTHIDPVALLPATRTPVLLVNGTTDEFFPLASHAETLSAIPASTTSRTSLVANYDHGCFVLTGLEPRATIEDRAQQHADGGLQLWFHHWFGSDAAFRDLPATPQVLVQDVLGATAVVVVADAPDSYVVEGATFWWSNDDATSFLGVGLSGSGSNWSALPTALPYSSRAISYVEVTYRTRELLPRRFWLATAPSIPPGHVPTPRGITSCLP